MNTPIEEYFDKIFVINLARRLDRWTHVEREMDKLGITEYERFEAYDRPIDHHGNPNGNMGCTSSHRALYEIIAYNKWPRVLIFEDDFAICTDFPQATFGKLIAHVPENWDMLYLGGHYGGEPSEFKRIYPIMPGLAQFGVIQIGRMLTTSSYGITSQFARKIAPYINGVGPIDSLLTGFHTPSNNCFITRPRIFVQYPGMSDLTDVHSSNHHCMLDRRHEEIAMLKPL